MNIVSILIAIAAGLLIVRVGFGMLRSLAQPIPEPPPPGELRKVRIVYRCSLCGTEVRMTSANVAQPEPPRHCMEDREVMSVGDV